ncbi:hypothetical protein EAH79_11570 [Sphingomonas koreensis]|nr:hypothetical protein EAH79_11570 [Sphingomonas koreensis]
MTSGDKTVRKAHRWIATAFFGTVALNFTTMIWGRPPAWITYAPLPPLFLLMGSGLTMLVAPSIHAWRSRRPQSDR